MFKPKEISKKTGITTRQIADITEKGVAQPALDTMGRGSSRHYDKKGVFSLILAASVRGILSSNEQKTFVAEVLRKESRERSRFGLLDHDLSGLIAIGFSNDSMDAVLSGKYFSRMVLDLSGVRKTVSEF